MRRNCRRRLLRSTHGSNRNYEKTDRYLVFSDAGRADFGGGKRCRGDKVVLHPNGRWEFVDAKKQTEAKKVADQFPENQGCPPGWQGGALGFGRCIPPGDKDFNRGSMGRR